MEVMLGFVLGILASFGVWFFVERMLIPKLEFHEHVYVDRSEGGSPEYRIRYRNPGRALIDLEFIVKLRIQGLRQQRPGLWRAIYIPVDDNRIPLVPRMSENQTRSVRLMVGEIEAKYHSSLPREARTVWDAVDPLSELLDTGSASELEVHAFSYDRFSGSREHHWRTYSAADFKGEEDFLRLRSRPEQR